MPKLSDEDQCMLDMMEITGFPMEIKFGLYVWHRSVESKSFSIFKDGYVATADFNKAVSVFEFWKERRNED
jgi:hypothetical protein